MTGAVGSMMLGSYLPVVSAPAALPSGSFKSTPVANSTSLDGNFGGTNPIGTGDFTVEFWYYNNDTAANRCVWECRKYPAGDLGFGIRTNGTAGWLYIKEAGTIGLSTTTGRSQNTWQHLALVRSGTTATLYINGNSIATGTGITNNYTNNSWRIGGFYDSNVSTYVWAGYLDEYRVSNNARYTANFTPTTTALSSDANTLLLLHMDGTNGSTTFTDSSSYNRTITVGGTASVSTSVYKI